ncbi:DUF3114 domain-containing protein [Xylocopilactobacillus apicola]|uniref:LXG domain-containing protein n=1 Tax=Xylocopilactobacillus apicola TaxID=2932184 RepID=A0AAU9DVH1_9LACO|nr:DUF3114 domain-containing protein [Xylocopilactobacillus apicola]BDR59483.1 hypothetical protein XA3_19240 [Xylocopilactobacillus apicola]
MVKIKMSEVLENYESLKRDADLLQNALKDVNESMLGVPKTENFHGRAQTLMLDYTQKIHETSTKKLNQNLEDLTKQMHQMINIFKSSVDNSDDAVIISGNLEEISKKVKNAQTSNISGETLANNAAAKAASAGANVYKLSSSCDELLHNLNRHIDKTKTNLMTFHSRKDLDKSFDNIGRSVVRVKTVIRSIDTVTLHGDEKFILGALLEELAADGWSEGGLNSLKEFIKEKMLNAKDRVKVLNNIAKSVREVGSDAFNALIRPYAQEGGAGEPAQRALKAMLKYLGAEMKDGYLKIPNGFPTNLDPFHNEFLQELLPRLVQNAFPFNLTIPGGLSTARGDFAAAIHQLRYYVSYANAVYVENEAKKLGIKPAVFLDLLTKMKGKDLKNHPILSKYADTEVTFESSRPHNKLSSFKATEEDFKGINKVKENLRKAGITDIKDLTDYNNYKLLSKFNVEFIVNNKTGDLLKVNLNNTAGKNALDYNNWDFDDLNGFINGPSYNYSNTGDMNKKEGDNENYKLDARKSSHYNYDYNYWYKLDMPNRNKATSGGMKIYVSPGGDNYDANTPKTFSELNNINFSDILKK